uniref:Substrate-binding domain-containing protein n=1 Tax=Roseihalotalea indica TaxID=2867963 RepID=A0AA49GLH2_9BACT|nr:substrate-binding domain-containing protein [Tunicatimonas sp. TK19036]
MARRRLYWLGCLLLIGIGGCRQKEPDSPLSTPTSGQVAMVVDEAFRPLISAEIQAFEQIYPQASITGTYDSEGKAIQQLLQNRASLVVVGRKLYPEELQALEAQKIVPQQVKAAVDGIALILNRTNPDTLFSYQEVVDLLRGNLNSWSSRPGGLSQDQVQLVFDHSQSGIIQWLKDSIAHTDTLPDYCFALNDHEEVINYVTQNPQALGLIGVSWISDQDDSTVNRFLRQIRVAAIAPRQAEDSSHYYQPYAAYLAQRKYPLTRDIYLISREARAGLASGFTAFVCGDKGQRIVLKSGLVPATMPIRIVQLVSEY